MSEFNRQDSRVRRDTPVDMTPMVDVTFLLLIFFMVTASFALQHAIAMPRQTSQLPSITKTDLPPMSEFMSLSVSRYGSFFLTTNRWEQELVGKQSLITALKQAASQARSDTTLEILIDGEARLQLMVDAIDAATIAQIVSLTVKQTDNLGSGV